MKQIMKQIMKQNMKQTMRQNQRRLFLLALAAGGMSGSLPLLAQERRMRRIVFLGAGTVATSASYLVAFRQGMADLRWVDGRDYMIEPRYGNNVPQALSGLADEIVASKPDLLLTTNNLTAMALAKSTQTIPIVFGISSDPVASGIARSLQRPGGNLTGMTTMAGELGPKRLEVLRDAVPAITHVAVLFDPADASSVAQTKEIAQAATRLRLRVTQIEIRQTADIAPAFKRGAAQRINAYIPTQGALFTASFRALADNALQFKMPGINSFNASVEAGGLLSYGPSNDDNFRRTAAYVDKILKGAKPGDLPIEQPVKFELVVNMKTAKAMGLVIPQTFLLRADRLIE